MVRFEDFKGIIQDNAEDVLRTGVRGMPQNWPNRTFCGALGGETGSCLIGVEGAIS